MGFVDNGTFDELPEQHIDNEAPSKTVNTALKMVHDFFPIKNEKEVVVEKIKDYYQKLYAGGDPTRADQLMSYLPVILVNLFTKFAKVPDSRIVETGYIPEFELLMSKFLEAKLDEAGYVDMMTTKFSGYHQAATYGNFFVLAMSDLLNEKGATRSKVKKGEQLFKLQGLSVGNAWFDRQSTCIRSKYVSQDATRAMITTTIDIFSADLMFPGIAEKTIVGNLPGTNGDEINPTNRKTDQQIGQDADTEVEIGFFFDIVNMVFSIVAGSNAYEYKTIEGQEFEKIFSMLFRGKEQVMLPISQFQMEPMPEGIYGAGLPEMFWRIISSDEKMNNSLINNVLESNASPLILNIENADAGRLMQQLKRGKSAMENGQRPIIIPEGVADDNGNITNPVGQGNVSYVKPNELSGENDRARVLMESIMRRLGWNVDINFTDPNKTLGQTELDVSNFNQNISAVHSDNKDFYEFITWFAADRIIKFGNENDDTPFGRDITIDIKGEEQRLSDVIGQEITEGFIVSLFKAAKGRFKIEIDTKNGVVFNDALERRNLERRLARATPGSAEFVRLMSALSIAEGGKSLKLNDLTGEGGETAAPQQQNELTQLEQ